MAWQTGLLGRSGVRSPGRRGTSLGEINIPKKKPIILYVLAQTREDCLSYFANEFQQGKKQSANPDFLPGLPESGHFRKQALLWVGLLVFRISR